MIRKGKGEPLGAPFKQRSYFYDRTVEHGAYLLAFIPFSKIAVRK